MGVVRKWRQCYNLISHKFYLQGGQKSEIKAEMAQETKSLILAARESVWYFMDYMEILKWMFCGIVYFQEENSTGSAVALGLSVKT